MNAFAKEILQTAARLDLPSEAVVMALAEVLATTAVALDREGSVLTKARIEDRLHAFSEHVIRCYLEQSRRYDTYHRQTGQAARG